MESDPLVTKTSQRTRMINYTSEDGSSILDDNHHGIVDGDETSLSPHNNDQEKADNRANDYILIERFHEDALLQVGYGKTQVVLFVVLGLVLSADLAHVLALIMSAKSAQYEFCVDETQKSWLVSANLLGMGIGSILWGFLGDRVGRRRALIYALGVGSIFSGASVIMPTEGTFITAILFSGVGLGGCLPLSITYFGEFFQEKQRRLAISLLFLFWSFGAGLTLLSSWFILPETGFHLSEELKEHFSAWRKLLLAASAPALTSILLLFFMPEAPLTLMKCGRDAESLDVYKQLHKWNRGKRTAFCISEVEIPTSNFDVAGSPSDNAWEDLRSSLKEFWSSFLTIWTVDKRRLTVRIFVIWFLASMGTGALSSWVLSIQATLRDWTFDKDAKYIENATTNNSLISQDLVNLRYRLSTFENVTFANVMMNHVKFENCTFNHVNLTNVKASFVLFINSNLSDCQLVDTDLGRSNFQNCHLENISYAGLNPTCPLIPDFNMQLSTDMIDSGLPVLGIFMGSLLTALLMSCIPRFKLLFGFLLLSSLVSIALTLWWFDATWAMIGHTLMNVCMASMWSILVTTIDKYPFWVRGGALGLCSAGGRIGSFFGIGLFGTTLYGILVPVFSSVCLVIATSISSRTYF